MKTKLLITALMIIPTIGISQKNQPTQAKNIDSLVIEIHKEIIEIKENQKNLFTKEDFEKFKQIEKPSRKELNKKVKKLEKDSIRMQDDIDSLKQQLIDNEKSQQDLNIQINNLKNKNEALFSKAKDLDDFAESYRKYLKSSSMLDTNFTTQILTLKSAANYTELKNETDEFIKIQQKLSGIENKLKKNTFIEFPELKSDLSKLTINSSFVGLKGRKDFVDKDLVKISTLFDLFSKKIKEVQALNLGQSNFNAELSIRLVSLKLSYNDLFDKYPFIYYQIDQVMKNQKHILPVIN
jgi:chromosome segregation ATPase